MRKQVLIEGAIILLLGVAGVAESLRLILYKDDSLLYDVLGPGYYILILSVAIILAGLIFVRTHYNAPLPSPAFVDRSSAHPVLASIGIFAAYLVLIDFLGYLLATLVFFTLQFKISGVSRWRTTLICSVIATALFHVLFIRYLNVNLPKGVLGIPW